MSSDDTNGLKALLRSIGSSGRFQEDATGRGRDESPEIVLEGRDPGGASLAVTLEDVTHPLFGTMAHWLIWNIEPTDRIPAAIPHGKEVDSLFARQGLAYGWHRYRGPKPPRGKTHTYRFTVYVLDERLDLSARSRRKALLRAIEGHVLQRAVIEGTFE